VPVNPTLFSSPPKPALLPSLLKSSGTGLSKLFTMKNIRSIFLLLALWCSAAAQAQAQQDPSCASGVVGAETYTGGIFFNYGSVSGAFNNKNRHSSSVGEPLIGIFYSKENVGGAGFWTRFIAPPSAPTVVATQGDLLDRIQLKWTPDPLSPSFDGGFNIYRDGILIGSTDKTARSFNDFNVIAGVPYNYEVRGINIYGEGAPGKALGFQVPNGTVTGLVETLNGSPVPGALVTLTPMQGFSAQFGPTDGGFAQADTATKTLLPLNSPWSLTFWMNTDSASAPPGQNAGVLLLGVGRLHIKALNSAISPLGGLVISGTGITSAVVIAFPDTGWHHVAAVYNAGRVQFFLDGTLKAIRAVPAVTTLLGSMSLGARTPNPGWAGRLDELRIYDRPLDELDLDEVMEGTASSLTPNLLSYWKFDEGQGTKSFDVLRRNKLYFCGAKFDGDRPPVRTSAITNSDGYYRIESASYGTGTTFLAEPSKYFYKYRALRFSRSMLDYATLPNFALAPKTTIEVWANSTAPEGTQTLVAKKWGINEFQLLLVQAGTDNQIRVNFNGTSQDFGLLGMGYHHLAVTVDSSGTNRTVNVYRDGSLAGSRTFTGIGGNWSDPSETWALGAHKSGTGYANHFNGLIGEVAFYDTTLSNAAIFDHWQSARDQQERGLRAYFTLDEGSGNRLNNTGSLLTGVGSLHTASGTGTGPQWSVLSPHQEKTPHEFTPATRQATLNPSITSVDRIDFTDRSTVPVTGFVRYANTDCFAEQVEILVNGQPYNPAIYTDSLGRFLIDLDPGATVTLSPKFKDHQFSPAAWEVVNIASPIAGVLFNDITVRKVTGRVAGGLCKKNILEPTTVCRVKVSSLDGCFERTAILDNAQEGAFSFLNLPPISMTVAVVEHSDPLIKTAFQVQGGSTADLSERDTMLDFIYFAPPLVELSGIDPDPPCAYAVLDQYEQKTLTIRIKEEYLGEACYVDTAAVRIIDGFGGGVKDTTLSGGTLLYKFRVGVPNPTPPYLQTLQVVGKTLGGNETSTAIQAIITGIRPKEQFFTTKLPETPMMVLHDPPGDGSYAYIEEGETFCSEITAFFQNDDGLITHGHFDLGPKAEVAGVDIEVIIATDADFTTTISKVNDTTTMMCRTTMRRISTSEQDLIVGSEQGGDVFVGTGLNIILGLSDEVVVDANCTPSVNVIVTVQPGEFATNFFYSEYHITNNILVALQLIVDDILADPDKPDEEAVPFQESIARWEGFLENNKATRARTVTEKNISFDAFVGYESSETVESSVTKVTGRMTIPEGTVTEQLGTYAGGIGADLTLGYAFRQVRGKQADTTEGKSLTIGYVLADDDAGDAFTMNIGPDDTYGTPVFNIVSGQSNCPWEPGTAHREGCLLSLRDGSTALAVDVPAHEPAVFKMTLGNTSATNEDWSYYLTTGPESNPHGAKIFLNGAALDKPITYAIPYGTSIPVTVTLERGPEEYDYDSLEVVLYSLCEDDRATALGIRPDDDTILYSPIYISAHFIRPCSEVQINVPEQNWVVRPDATTPGPDDVLRITTSGYTKSVEEFDRIRVQYRASNGDGAWINIVPPDPPQNPLQNGAEVLKADLGASFTQFFWNTEGLADGNYEIRAIAVCQGNASDQPGYSQLIKGRIDRQPPSLVGTPEPSDGVFHVGDEISFTFNKPLNCNKLIEADLTQPNNVGLYDATTGQLIDIEISCYENKIILVPKFQNQFFENRILRAELHNIRDLTGNMLVETDWEFFVDRNELAWLTDSLGMTKNEDEIKTVTASIHNRGGSPVPFSILGAPAWVRVVPDRGTLVPNEIRPIQFEVDSTLAFGHWSDSITLRTETGQNPFFMGGDENLPFGVRVVCRPPDWDLDAGIHPVTMNMVLELDIQGTVSTDYEDIAAAFIDGELRGRARVIYLPAVDKHLAYLTIYGESSDALKPVLLQIWDASACLRFGEVVENFSFQPDNVIGSALAPQVVHTTGLVLREVPFRTGWNWLSFNLAFPDPAINPALASLQHPDNDLLKGQSQFSVYGGGTWVGSLSTLSNTTMYQYRADQPDTLKMLGQLIDPTTVTIPLVSGWNWLGYVPSFALPIDDALSSISAQTGDIIKGQTAFAQYISSFGWLGNLKFLQPPQGYQIRLTNPANLTYPLPSPHRPSLSSLGHSAKSSEGQITTSPHPQIPSFWTVNPAQYEHSMTLIGMLRVNGANATAASMELGAFVGSEVRGSAQAIYIAPLQTYLFFLTAYANAGGEQMRFKLFESGSGTVQDLVETMWFASDLHQGSIESPVPFSLKTSGLAETSAEQSFDVQPNPFSHETLLRFSLPDAQEVVLSIADVNGREVAQSRFAARSGLNTMTWDGTSDTGQRLGNGVYFVRLRTESGTVTRKVMMQR
jgi:hypothetical protein